jgi:hypothetical protein
MIILRVFLSFSLRHQQSLHFGFFDGLLIPAAAIIILDIESSHVFEADLHALLFGGREQLVLEGVDAGIEALRVEEHRQLLVLHIDAIRYYLIDVRIGSEYFVKIHKYIPL